MKIKQMPWYNQPWVRVEKDGVSVMNDAELLAAVLGKGNEDENAIDLSNRVLFSCNFSKLAHLSLPELKQVFRGDIHAKRIQAMFEIFRRTNKLTRHGFTKKITTAQDVFNHFIDILIEKKKEHFYALLLDSKNRIISEELISVGTLNSSLIHPREVFNPAIKMSSNALILVHNHPSGDCTPSEKDKEVTKSLAEVGKLVGVSVLDHVIIGKDQFISLKEEGLEF